MTYRQSLPLIADCRQLPHCKRVASLGKLPWFRSQSRMIADPSPIVAPAVVLPVVQPNVPVATAAISAGYGSEILRRVAKM